MALGAELFLKYHSIENFKATNEIQFTTMLAIIGHWRKHHKEDFIVIHDASSNFSRQNEVWEKITNNDVPPQEHLVGDGTYVDFPLRVISTEAVDSKDNYSVQLCDVIAGLFVQYFRAKREGDNQKLLIKISEAGMEGVNYNGVRPELVFPDKMLPRPLACAFRLIPTTVSD